MSRWRNRSAPPLVKPCYDDHSFLLVLRFSHHESLIDLLPIQGWKLQAVRLSGTGKNRAGQLKNLDTFPKERLKFWKLLSVCMSRTGKR